MTLRTRAAAGTAGAKRALAAMANGPLADENILPGTRTVKSVVAARLGKRVTAGSESLAVRAALGDLSNKHAIKVSLFPYLFSLPNNTLYG